MKDKAERRLCRTVVVIVAALIFGRGNDSVNRWDAVVLAIAERLFPHTACEARAVVLGRVDKEKDDNSVVVTKLQSQHQIHNHKKADKSWMVSSIVCCCLLLAPAAAIEDAPYPISSP